MSIIFEYFIFFIGSLYKTTEALLLLLLLLLGFCVRKNAVITIWRQDCWPSISGILPVLKPKTQASRLQWFSFLVILMLLLYRQVLTFRNIASADS